MEMTAAGRNYCLFLRIHREHIAACLLWSVGLDITLKAEYNGRA